MRYTHTPPPHTHKGILFSHKKDRNLVICYNMDGPWEHYAQWNKSDEKQILHDLPYTWNWKKENKTKNQTNKQKTELLDSENRLVVARGVSGAWWGCGMGGGVGKIHEGGQKIQTSSYKINKPCGWNAEHGDYS